nr:hypothetical protein [Enterococcus faecium]
MFIKGGQKMCFFTTFTIIMIAVLFIFLDIAKRNTVFLLYRVLLRAGLITFISIVGFFLFTVIVFIWRTTAPPLPEITYGEFPFSLEYEIDEERILIEDTVIAEFIGSFRGNVTTQPRRSWSIKLLNNSGELKAFHYEFLIIESEDVTITLSSGSAGYFMNDGGSKPQLTVRDRIAGFMHFSHYDLEEARKILAEYGITLINWEYAPPIRNFFNDYY